MVVSWRRIIFLGLQIQLFLLQMQPRRKSTNLLCRLVSEIIPVQANSLCLQVLLELQMAWSGQRRYCIHDVLLHPGSEKLQERKKS
jgi:hypothetical protein